MRSAASTTPEMYDDRRAAVRASSQGDGRPGCRSASSPGCGARRYPVGGMEPTIPLVLAEVLANGFALAEAVVDRALVGRLRRDVDAALAAERRWFPPGDDQYGRLLFAPVHGGAFIDLLGDDELFAPIEAVIPGGIVYTMTTSVLRPGEIGPISDYHRDFPIDRPSGLALAAMVLLDPFSARSGATEFIVGSHLDETEAGAGAREPIRLTGSPGDVCYFDPKVLHRARRNGSQGSRRSVLVQMIQPWMKQRVDVREMLRSVPAAPGPAACRRLGRDSLPPGTYDEFAARRADRPW